MKKNKKGFRVDLKCIGKFLYGYIDMHGYVLTVQTYVLSRHVN